MEIGARGDDISGHFHAVELRPCSGASESMLDALKRHADLGRSSDGEVVAISRFVPVSGNLAKLAEVALLEEALAPLPVDLGGEFVLLADSERCIDTDLAHRSVKFLEESGPTSHRN